MLDSYALMMCINREKPSTSIAPKRRILSQPTTVQIKVFGRSKLTHAKCPSRLQDSIISELSDTPIIRWLDHPKCSWTVMGPLLNG